MIILALLVFLITLIGGCIFRGENFRYTEKAGIGFRREIPIWVDVKFGEADRISIEEAIGRWNYVLNGSIRLRVVDLQFGMEDWKINRQIRERGWIFMKLRGDDISIPKLNGEYQAIGFVESVGGSHLYLIRDRMRNEQVFGVTMHEIGHLLGAEHVGNRLMSPHFSMRGNQCIDYDTVLAVSKYQGIGIEDLNYCYEGTRAEGS